MNFLKIKRNWILIFFAILLISGISGFAIFHFSPGKELTFPEFMEKLEAGMVSDIKIRAGNSLKSSLTGTFSEESGESISFTVPVLLQYQENLHQLLADHGFPAIEQEAEGSSLQPVLIFYTLFFILIGIFMAQALGIINLAPGSGHRLASPEISFKDVAGVDDAKGEIIEVVNLIRNRTKISDLGGAIPKGILLVGPPGSGKTLLAKAIASESEIPFFEMSGSSFVEKYVGTGAARVRSLFKKARKAAPCIVFIDEIDAVGGRRTESGDGAAREHNQTLNALLIEMDGASGRNGVIVVAATNRKETLDPALLRPGRFDRTLRIDLPDLKGREEILHVHSRKIKLGSDADLKKVARMTPGFSGAELAALLNEAALTAGRRKADKISSIDLAAGRDRILLGSEKTGTKLNDREKWLTAWHEAGHTVVNHFVAHGQNLERVTILPRGDALGVTLMMPEEKKYGETRLQLLDTICVLMGGRAAEEIFLGDISSGAGGDIGMATRYAKKMVCEWGMSSEIGMVRYENQNEEYLSSHSAGREIEKEIRNIISEQYRRAIDLVKTHRKKVERLTRELVERETLMAEEVEQILSDENLNDSNPGRDLSEPVLLS